MTILVSELECIGVNWFHSSQFGQGRHGKAKRGALRYVRVHVESFAPDGVLTACIKFRGRHASSMLPSRISTGTDRKHGADAMVRIGNVIDRYDSKQHPALILARGVHSTLTAGNEIEGSTSLISTSLKPQNPS